LPWTVGDAFLSTVGDCRRGLSFLMRCSRPRGRRFISIGSARAWLRRATPRPPGRASEGAWMRVPLGPREARRCLGERAVGTRLVGRGGPASLYLGCAWSALGLRLSLAATRGRARRERNDISHLKGLDHFTDLVYGGDRNHQDPSMRSKAPAPPKAKTSRPSVVRASISFPAEVYGTLAQIAKQKKVSVAWVVRDAAEGYLAERWRSFRSGGVA